MDDTPVARPTTAAFHLQAAISFALSLGGVLVACYHLPTTGWAKAFLAMGVLYLTTSTFTLAKCIRDREESASILGRVDQARLEKLLAEHGPFRTSG